MGKETQHLSCQTKSSETSNNILRKGKSGYAGLCPTHQMGVAPTTDGGASGRPNGTRLPDPCVQFVLACLTWAFLPLPQQAVGKTSPSKPLRVAATREGGAKGSLETNGCVDLEGYIFLASSLRAPCYSQNQS